MNQEQIPTAEQLAKKGFTKINGSMWRNGNITLQNHHIFEGNTLLERLINIKKGFKVCINKKYHSVITSMSQLEKVLENIK